MMQRVLKSTMIQLIETRSSIRLRQMELDALGHCLELAVGELHDKALCDTECDIQKVIRSRQSEDDVMLM